MKRYFWRSLLILVVGLTACVEDAEVSTPTLTPNVTVVNAPELIMVDEKVGEITISFELSGDQSLDTDVLISLDAANSTAVEGEDFLFDEEVITIPAYIKYGSFTVTIIDNPARDKDNYLTINMGPNVKGPTVTGTASTRIEISNFEDDEIQLINDWTPSPLTFEIENTVRSGGVDTYLWATGVNAMNQVTGFLWDFVPDTVITSNYDTIITYQTEIVENAPCDVDFDIYYYDSDGNNVAANWVACPEIAYVTEVPGTGYLMSDDISGSDVSIPYGTYTATLDLWDNGFAVNSYDILGEVFAGYNVVNLQQDYPTYFVNNSSAYREGFYDAGAVTSEGYFNVGITGWALGITTLDEKPIYTVDLQPGMISLDYINGDNIMTGRYANLNFDHVKRQRPAIDLSNLDLKLIK